MLSVEKAKVIRGNRNLERRVMQVGERKNRLIRAVGATSRGRDRRGKEGREERGERR